METNIWLFLKIFQNDIYHNLQEKSIQVQVKFGHMNTLNNVVDLLSKTCTEFLELIDWTNKVF